MLCTIKLSSFERKILKKDFSTFFFCSKDRKIYFKILRTNEDHLIVLICLYFEIKNIVTQRFYLRVKKLSKCANVQVCKCAHSPRSQLFVPFLINYCNKNCKIITISLLGLNQAPLSFKEKKKNSKYYFCVF